MAENRILFHLFFCYIFFSKIIELAKELLLNDNGINIIYLYIAAHSIMKTSLLCIYFSKPKTFRKSEAQGLLRSKKTRFSETFEIFKTEKYRRKFF